MHSRRKGKAGEERKERRGRKGGRDRDRTKLERIHTLNTEKIRYFEKGRTAEQ